MFEVVFLKRDRARQEVREIRQDGERPVPDAAAEDQIVCTLVDEDPERVADESPAAERGEENQPDGLLSKKPRRSRLKADEEQHQEGAPRIASGQAPDRRVLPEELPATRRVRFSRGGTGEVPSGRAGWLRNWRAGGIGHVLVLTRAF